MTITAAFTILLTVAMFGIVIYQIRQQRISTEAMLNENRTRTRLYQDADDSTTFILNRTIQNVSAGHSDPSLESDSFALRVIRELVKRRVSKEYWLELQTNERLLHVLFVLLRSRD
ncbi:MAG: hypothetical protein GY784_03170 [Gammaproteobacteria bacterium]|nr:hypothetical protein [Gammaproteobacteria bacterium]